jgi:hypothetical protein
MAFFLRGRRTKNLMNGAVRHGFTFMGNIDFTPKDKFASLRLFTLQSPGTMKNVLKYSSPPLWVFDYEYFIPRDQDVGQTVALFEMSKTDWPPLVVESRKRERFTVAAMRLLTQKIANWQLSYKEVDFSFNPKFSKHYRVFCGNDQERLKDLIAAPALDFFCQNPGWNVEALNQWLLIYRHGKYVKPKELDTFINSVFAIYEFMKR